MNLIELLKSKGVELSADEISEVEKIDEAQALAEEEKGLEALATKLLEKIDGRKAEITDEKAVAKETFAKMSSSEKEEAFFKAVVRNDIASLKALTVGTDSQGGYLVPDETLTTVLDYITADSTIRANANVINNCPAHLDITSLATDPTAYFRSELGSKTASQPSFAQVALTPYSVAVLVPLSNELRTNAMVAIAPLVINAMRRALVTKEEEVFASGDGSGKPTGLEDYYSAYPVARKVTGGTLVDRLIKADVRLAKAYRAKAKWYMPTSQLEIIRTEKDANDRPIFQDDMTGEFVGRLLGKPVEINDNLTNIWYGDMSGYVIGQGIGGITVAQSEDATVVQGEVTYHLFQQNMFAIRVEESIDGELVNNKALIAVQAGTESGS